MQLTASSLVVALALHTCLAFSPNITIQSCASRRVVIRLVDAADGGLLFIQGAGKECIKTTRPSSMEHEFNFDTCNIEYDSKFRLVIQQHPHYQIGTDKVIPIMCLVDRSDLLVSGVIYPEEGTDDKAVNKTIKPSVRMRIVAGDDNSVDEVTLNDKIKMMLTLDDPYMQDFDIKAKDCVASRLSLLKEECSSDEELFPNFDRKRQGALQSEFLAFQPTSLLGQSETDVAFMCNVTVCKGQCRQTVCGQIVGWGRKRRDDPDEYEKVTVGCKLRVKKPDPDMALTHGLKATPEFFCGEKMLVTSVIAVVLVTLVFSWLICALVFVKMRRLSKLSAMGIKRPGPLRRMSHTGSNIAKSVGRRLSTILNLPVGYNVKDPKMMDAIQEMPASPGPDRRDSVTVSPHDNSDVSYVSVFPNSDQTQLRRRLVDSSAQTDDVMNMSVGDVTESKPKKNPFSFITSISIKSGVSKNAKQKGFANPAFSQSFDVGRSNAPRSQNLNVNDGREHVVTYGENDVPRNRSRSAQNLDQSRTFRSAFGSGETVNTPNCHGDRSSSPDPDYEEKDVSFNDGSVNDVHSYTKSSSGSRDSNASSENCRYVNTNRSFNEHETATRTKRDQAVVPKGNRFDDDVSNDAGSDVTGRLSPEEHIYEPIEIVSKPKCLTRTFSTHV